MEEYTDIKKGSLVKIVNPISDLEMDMVNKYNIEYLEFVEWVDNGYARCKDLDIGAKWIVHPESLDYADVLNNKELENLENKDFCPGIG
ncbi:MAG: hypothetical protein ACOCP4_03135 [Candidatus Woesearchaeota archaeon]